MANYLRCYFGPYVKVYPPEMSYANNIQTCPDTTCTNYGIRIHDSYCAACGSLIRELSVTQKGHENLNDFLERELGDSDLFYVVHMDNKDYQFLISNTCFEQGGTYIKDHGEYLIPENPDYLDRKDWVRLVDKLEEKGYKFEGNIGVIAYYD